MFNSFFNLNFTSILTVFLTCASSSIAQSSESELAPPLKEDAWVVLYYSKIPSNRVTFASNSLTVKVKSSAGPIVHKLERPKKIIGFEIKGKTIGPKKIETGAFDEDSILRFGFVTIGTQTLTGPQKWFASDWVKKIIHEDASRCIFFLKNLWPRIIQTNQK